MEYFVIYVGVKDIPSHRVESYLRIVKKEFKSRENERYFLIPRLDSVESDIKKLDVQQIDSKLFTDLLTTELMNARADIATKIAPFVSYEWIQKNVFDMSEDEIVEINRQMALEKKSSSSENTEDCLNTIKSDDVE